MRRRLLQGAAFGGGGAGLLGAIGYAVLWTQAKLARRAVPTVRSAPLADGPYGESGDGSPIRLAMLGDSSASGVGADVPTETPGALLAAGLADSGRPVLLDVLAVSGSRSADLEPQVSRALLNPPHVAVVCVGANDVTHMVPENAALASLRAAVTRLVEAGVRVIVGTCPDLGTVAPIPQPLRALVGRRSRALADAQLEAMQALGVVAIPLGRLLGPTFAADEAMFCDDRFHPSAAGYRLVAEMLGPAVLAAVGGPLAVDPVPPQAAPLEALAGPAGPEPPAATGAVDPAPGDPAERDPGDPDSSPDSALTS